MKLKFESTLTGASKGNITGIANTFNKTLNGNTYTKEAFKSSLGKTVPLLVSHDWGALPVGTATFEAIEETGVTYRGTIFENVNNRELLLEQLASKTVGVSIGGIANGFNEAGNVTSMELLELSLTAIPADQGATAVLESLNFKEEDTNPGATETSMDKTDGKTGTDETTLDTLRDLIVEEFNKAHQSLKEVNDKLDGIIADEDGTKDGDKKDTPEAGVDDLKEALSLIKREKLTSIADIKLYNKLHSMV